MIYRLRESDTHKTITPELQKKVCAILLANMQQEQEEHERSKSDWAIDRVIFVYKDIIYCYNP